MSEFMLFPKVILLFLHWLKTTEKVLGIQTAEKNHPKIGTMGLCHGVMHLHNADERANTVDPDQTANSVELIWVYNVCSDLAVGKQRIITVELQMTR